VESRRGTPFPMVTFESGPRVSPESS
jgi:hypothetical protein